jgi:HEPN domain-containing protein
MKPLTREWIEKAEGDFATASREMRARKFPNYDAACFHSQQCVEKYFKALLQETRYSIRKDPPSDIVAGTYHRRGTINGNA